MVPSLRRLFFLVLFCSAAASLHAAPEVFGDWFPWAAPYVSPGGAMIYEFDGYPDPWTSGTFTIHLPSAVTYVKVSGYGDCKWTVPTGSGGDVVCTTTFWPYEETDYYVYVTVSPSVAPGTVLKATMTFDAGSYGSSTQTLSTTVVAPVDLSVSASGSRTARAGTTYPLTVRLTNNGSSTSYGPEFRLSRPAGSTLQFVKPTVPGWNCVKTTSPPKLSCEGPDLAPGASEELAVDTWADPTAATDAVHVMDIMWNSDPNTANDTLDAVTPLSSTIAASASASVYPSPARVISDYTIGGTIVSDGPSARDVVVTYDTPPNTVYVSRDFGTGFTCTTPAAGAAGQVRCSAPLLTATVNSTHSAWSFNITVHTNTPGIVTHTFSAAASNFAKLVTASTTVDVQDSLITLTSSATQAGTQHDQDSIIGLYVEKPYDPWTADGLTVDFTPPAGAVFKGTRTTGVTCTATRCSLPPLPSYRSYGNYAEFILQLPSTPGPVPLTYTIHGNGVAPLTVTKQLDVTAPQLAASLTASPARVLIGDDAAFTLNVTNTGNVATAALAVTGTIPANLAIHDVSTTAGSCSQGPQLNCTIPGLAPSAKAVIRFSGRAAQPAADATVTTSVTGGGLSAGPVSATTTIVTPVVLMSAALTADRAVVRTDDRVIYTLTVHNAGPDHASVVAAEVTTRGEGAVVSVDTNGFASCGAGKSLVRCDMPRLDAGATATATITLVAPSSTGTMFASATVTTPSGAPQTANIATPVVARGFADIAVDATDSTKPAAVAQPFTLHYTVTNIGSNDAGAVVFDATSSAGITLQSLTTSRGTCSATHCTIGTLASGAVADITITAVPTRGGAESIHGAASTSSPESSTDNDAREVTVNVAVPRARAVRH